MHKFSELPYPYSALEPHIDAVTMEIHHSRHHKTYFDKFVGAIQGSENENKSLEKILGEISKHPAAVRNNAGGFFNHNFFWNCMSPNGKRKPEGKLAEAINSAFGSYEELKNKMNQAGVARFGSGFAWLIVDANGNLKVVSTPNQDNPLMDDTSEKGKPLMTIDIWEHAYYLKYQNKRPDYLQAFWNVVDWTHAEKNFGA